MNGQLGALIALQTLDLETDQLEGQKRDLFREMESLEENLRTVHQEIEERKFHIAEYTRERKKREAEAENARQASNKSKVKLHAIKTNKEYTALLKEIENDEARISTLEDQILDMMERLEEENVRLEEKTALLAGAEEECRQERQKKEAEIGRLDAVLEEKRKAREAVIAPLKDRLYQSYTRLSLARKGLAVVAVRAGVCQGCYLTIPPQTVNEIRKNEEIITCVQCNRMLYWVP